MYKCLVPHLPNFNVMRFGSKVGSDASNSSSSNSSFSSSNNSSAFGKEDDDESKRGPTGPRVGCDRSATDKFLGSGRMKKTPTNLRVQFWHNLLLCTPVHSNILPSNDLHRLTLIFYLYQESEGKDCVRSEEKNYAYRQQKK